MRRPHICLAALAAVVAILAQGAVTSAIAAAPATPIVDYDPPVAEPPVSTFQPPATPYGPGRRGIEYRTAPGEDVGAVAPGVVAFAGPVAGALHVVVLHPDGRRSSYSFLARIAVARGDHVVAGQPVGVSAGSFHLGLRDASGYIDPLPLFERTAPRRAHLVPDDGRSLAREATERDGLIRSLAGLPSATTQAGRAAVVWAGAAGRTLAAGESAVKTAVVTAAGRLRSLGSPCTPPSVPAPVVNGHVAVLVAGLGSSSTSAGILDLPVGAIGYLPSNVVLFSYRAALPAADAPYGPADTQIDIRTSSSRLRTLLMSVALSHPGRPIDVIAHSQGGLVALAALARVPALAGVATLVALGTPFHGANLATAVALAGRTDTGRRLERLAGRVAGGLDATSASVHQLAQTSDFVRWLNRLPLPAEVPVTSIAAHGDVVVPSPRAWVDGATNVVVDVDGANQHARLPGSPAARREVALAVTGRPPTCRSPIAVARDVLAGEAVSLAEDAAGVGLAAGAAAIDVASSG